MERFNTDAEEFRPSRNALAHAMQFKVMCCPLIAGLLFGRSPSTISWFVVAVVVGSLNGSALGAFTHILKKIAEIHPAAAHRNTTATIVWILDLLWIRASLNHVIPRSVFG